MPTCRARDVKALIIPLILWKEKQNDRISLIQNVSLLKHALNIQKDKINTRDQAKGKDR